MNVWKNRTQKISTSELNETMLEIIEKTPPPAIKGKYIKIKYCTMLPTPTPTFGIFANLPQYIKEPIKDLLKIKLEKNITLLEYQLQYTLDKNKIFFESLRWYKYLFYYYFLRQISFFTIEI